MSNTLTEILPRLLARGLLALRETALMPLLVNRDYETEAKKKGSTIDIPISTARGVTDVTPGPNRSSVTDSTQDQVQIALDQWKMADFHLTDKDMVEIDANEHFMPMQASEAIRALGNVVNTHIFSKYVGIYGHAGTAGSTPFQSDASALINARKVLNDQLAPEVGRRHVMDTTAEAEALGLSTFADAEKTGENGVKIRGEMGMKYGFQNFYDNAVPEHTTGAAGTPLVDGASQVVGQNQLVVDGFSTKPSVGDIFTIAGDSTQYVVDAATDLSSGESTLTISPNLAVSPADNAAVTFVADHRVNLAFHREAFGFGSRPLLDAVPSMGNSIVAATDPVTGLSLRLEAVRLNKLTTYEYDILYGANHVRREYACRVLG